MNSQNEKEGSTQIRVAVIGGIFAVLVACTSGLCVLANTMMNGDLIFGTNIYNSRETQTANDYQAPTDSNLAQQQPVIENLGLWEFGKSRPLMPESAKVNQVIFVHGDIDNSGTCHVIEFGTGVTVQGLGDGTFRIVRISGTPEQIKESELEIQQIAANGAGGTCPWK